MRLSALGAKPYQSAINTSATNMHINGTAALEQVVVSLQARVPFIVYEFWSAPCLFKNISSKHHTEVLRRVTPAFALLVRLALRTMLERLMPVANVIEEVDLILAREERRADTVYRCVAPAFIVKATLLIEELEVLHVRLGTPEFERANLEVGPEVTAVVGLPTVIREEGHRVVLRNEVRVAVKEFWELS
jgi:hypothetical protein